jgi:15-cis-phytoene synthase
MGEIAVAIQPGGATVPPAVPSEARLLAQADHENFPVVTRLVPRAAREHLLAVYAFARLTDDIGDEHPGDRPSALDWLEGDLRAALEGRPSHPVTARLSRTIAATDMAAAPFFDLIAANRRDQAIVRQATWDELLDYCRLSANPIGTAVLAIAGAVTPERQALSDRVCSGLQVVEHLQDVREDAAAGRVYLPADDLERFGVVEADLTAPAASPALRSAVAFELARARELLAAGIPLTRSLRGWCRLAVAGYVAGGLAAADAIEDTGYDVLAVPVRPSRARTLRHALLVLASPEPRARHEILQPDLDRAYAACAEVTRRQAKNFAYGIALLPAPKRRALAVVYALARRVDDIVDEAGPTERRARALDELETEVTRTMVEGVAADPDDVVLVAFADVVRRYPLPPDAVADLFEGCRRDLLLARMATFDDLVVYCRQVAGSIGRLSLAIFGTGHASRFDGRSGGPEVTARLADDLGVALQLTNILRDVVEDRDQLGRVYLPADDLARFGCAPDASGPVDRLAALLTYEAELARGWYERGLGLLPHLDHRSRACVAAMAGIYHRLLDHIERDPSAVLRGRVSLTTGQKVAVAARSLLPFPGGTRA